MSRKPRTLVVTFAARSFSSLEPAATFCLSSPAMVSLAAFTAWVPGPAFPVAAGAGFAGAAGGAFDCAAAVERKPRPRMRPKARQRPRQRPTDARTIDQRSICFSGDPVTRGDSDCTVGELRTVAAGMEFTGGTTQAYHGDVPLEDRLRPA